MKDIVRKDIRQHIIQEQLWSKFVSYLCVFFAIEIAFSRYTTALSNCSWKNEITSKQMVKWRKSMQTAIQF